MRELRSQQTICFLIGPDHDRQEWTQYFGEAGFQVHVFKNPSVLFDFLKESKSLIVVLETSALRTKLSQWVSELQEINPEQRWISLAPISQYPILSTYQNRGLKEVVAIDQPYFKERTLWALDRQLEIFQAKQVPKVIETKVEKEEDQSFNMETYLELRAREAGFKNIPFSVLIMKLDDESEIQSFWGAEVLSKAKELLLQSCSLKWNSSNTHQWNDFVLITVNQSTADLIQEMQKLQAQVQKQARESFGFQISMSAGISELNIHTDRVQSTLQQATDACQNMLRKGGGRVGVPKPLKKDTHGDLPQNLG